MSIYWHSQMAAQFDLHDAQCQAKTLHKPPNTTVHTMASNLYDILGELCTCMYCSLAWAENSTDGTNHYLVHTPHTHTSRQFVNKPIYTHVCGWMERGRERGRERGEGERGEGERGGNVRFSCMPWKKRSKGLVKFTHANSNLYSFSLLYHCCVEKCLLQVKLDITNDILITC